MPKPQRSRFEKVLYADVNIDYIEQSDVDLIETGVKSGRGFPFLLARSFDENYYTLFFYIRSGSSFDEDAGSILSDLEKWGASSRMKTLFVELRRQGIHYLRIDPDGGEVEGDQIKKREE
jgi:hypothetical protein